MEQKVKTNETSLEKTKDNGTIVTNSAINTLNLLDDRQMVIAEAYMKRLMSSEKGGIKTVADGIAVLTRAQDLQLPFTTCIEHIHVVKGKTGIDVHIIKALLLRAGVVWEKTKDYTPQYNYTDGNNIYSETSLPLGAIKCRSPKEAEEKTDDDNIGVYPLRYYVDLNNTIYNEFQINDKFVKCINIQQARIVAKEGKFPVVRIPAQPIDFVTEYTFTRYQEVCGKVIERKCTSHFSYSEAKNAGFYEKENYIKYGRIMIEHRAFTLGARDIASDALMGCQEVTELKLANGMTISDSDFMADEVPLAEVVTE